MSDRPRGILLLAPGRSGSTLLQSAFLASCDVLTFFEPCRYGPSDGEALHRQRCVPHVLRFLECRLPQLRSRWDPPALRGWLQHPYNEANTSCVAASPFAMVGDAQKVKAIGVTGAVHRAKLAVGWKRAKLAAAAA